MNLQKFSPAKCAMIAFLLIPVIALSIILLGALAPAVALFVAVVICLLWLPLTWIVYIAEKQRRVLGTMEVGSADKTPQ